MENVDDRLRLSASLWKAIWCLLERMAEGEADSRAVASLLSSKRPREIQ
jgi:hypothetical protein